MAKNTVTSKTEENEEIRSSLKIIRRDRIVNLNMVRVFFVVLFAGAIVSMMLFLRPSYSDSEQRNLTKFPKFTFKALVSGDYFDGITLWFSDTFPFRDKFITLNSYIKTSFGDGKVQIHGDVEKGDVIPDISPDISNDAVEDTPVEPPVDNPDEQKPLVPPKYEQNIEQIGAILLIDDAAYEYYNFNLDAANMYTSYLNRAGSLLKGKANVYSMVVPNSMGVVAPENVVSQINTSDQKKAIDYLYSCMSEDVISIDVYTTLKKHKSEYIYFRTDHHWTARGAYYAYAEFIKKTGRTPTPINGFEEYVFPDYLGSFYNSSGKKVQLSSNPDTVFAYRSKSTENIYVYDIERQYESKIIRDASTMSSGNKYLTFICGDRPLSVIDNPNAPQGSVCTVIKDSYGNCFVPFVAENYSRVYVVDYRYFSQIDSRTLEQFVSDTATQDVVFLNNISATRNKNLIGYIGAFIG